MDLNKPQFFPVPFITSLCAAVTFRPYWAFCFSVLYLCRDVPSFPRKTGALRLQPKSLLFPPISNLTPKQKVFLLSGQTLPPYHMAGESRRQVSLKPQKNAFNCVWASCPLCPPVPSLARAQAGTQSRSGGRSCLWPAPHGHSSCWCSVQRQEHLRPPGPKVWSHRHIGVAGCEEDFSLLLLHLLDGFPVYRTF